MRRTLGTLIGFLIGLATIVPVVSPTPAAAAATVACDALCSRARAELGDFTGWLDRNGAAGYIGEVGWPGGADPRWNTLADRWFDAADAAGLWVTAWATGEWWPTYDLAIYDQAVRGGPIATPLPAAEVLERHATAGPLRGVNVNGGEFGAPSWSIATSSWSNVSSGVYGTNWYYDSASTFTYLASRGVRLVRLPFRWERLQPTLNGPLDTAELGRIRDAIGRAHAAGIQVIPTNFGYGAYVLHDGTQGVRRTIGSPQVPYSAFADSWRRLAAGLAGTPGIAGWGLMNEPANMAAVGSTPPAEVWEQASQAAVDAIRAAGDTRTVLVPGYAWSGVQRWSRTHPDAWITDPANRIRYEAHHYLDTDHDGRYLSYEEELAAAVAAGYTATTLPATTTSTTVAPTTTSTTVGPTTTTTAPTTTSTTVAPTTTTTQPTTTSTTAPTTTSTTMSPTPPATTTTPSTPAPAYRLLGANGVVSSFGSAPLGSANVTAAAFAVTPSGTGAWVATESGRVTPLGDAPALGSLPATPAAPIVGMAATPSGRGYWMLGRDGGVFAFGDAGFYGSTGGMRLNRPVVGMAPSPTGRGYWFVASDGGIFAFGDATFRGSTGGMKLNKDVVGMAATRGGAGYWLVARDGGVFAFGDAVFHGSTGSLSLNSPIVGMRATPKGDGYWFVGADGGVFAFGGAPFLGSLGAAGSRTVAIG